MRITDNSNSPTSPAGADVAQPLFVTRTGAGDAQQHFGTINAADPVTEPKAENGALTIGLSIGL